MPLLYESLSIISWVITVTDRETNKGVPNAKVYLFSKGGIQPPENADYSEVADESGAAHFDVPTGFYHVGIIAIGYESAYDPHNPPDEWKDVWTCWGAGGAGYKYDFQLKKIPGYEPPEEPKKLNLAIVGGFAVALAVIAGVFIIRRKKR